MGKRYDTLLFPGGLKKAFTISYDDGAKQDIRLLVLCDKYRIKGTFNLNYGDLGQRPERKYAVEIIRKEDVSELYKNQEIGGHGLYHSDLSTIGEPLAMYEIIEDKRNLEKIAEKPLRMFAYPYGTFNDDAKKILKAAGYKGARTVRSTHGFNLPEDTFELDPSCHHNDPELFKLAEEFVNSQDRRPQLFYVWGHSYEFDRDDNWDVIEEFLCYMDGHREEIWFAGNGEILAYLEAYKRLEYSADGSMIYNPSALDVEIATSLTAKELLKSGQVTRIKETVL